MQRLVLVCSVLLAITPAAAQESANFRISDHAFVAGGSTALSSPLHRITLVSVGPEFADATMASPGHGAAAGFGATYPPPGEVRQLFLDAGATLTWNPEPSVGVYNVYRGSISDLLSLDYGSCLAQGLAGPAYVDADSPPSNDGFLYLITAENRLGEEGSLGRDYQQRERPNASVCP